MTGAARQPTQADFDLERFIDMFDEALTSNDERVINALRSLMMIVVLTKPEVQSEHNSRRGPLRQLFDDMNNLTRRVGGLEGVVKSVAQKQEESSRYRSAYAEQDYVKDFSKKWPTNDYGGPDYTMTQEAWNALSNKLNTPTLLPKKGK